jgi:hypothetical protein
MESPEVMQAFLLWLGEDQSSGARRYEEIRRKLILLFRWRGCYTPEELADETIDRTARAVLKPDFIIREIRFCIFARWREMCFWNGSARSADFLLIQSRKPILSCQAALPTPNRTISGRPASSVA